MRHASVLAAAILVGCSYDWTITPVGSGGAGGVSPRDGGAHDAATDGPADAAHDAGRDAAEDADAGSDCAALATELATARTDAKACTLGAPGQCVTSIVDECGCASYVAEAGSAAASAFASAVSAFRAAGCVASCATMCLPSSGACLLNGGSAAACVP